MSHGSRMTSVGHMMVIHPILNRPTDSYPALASLTAIFNPNPCYPVAAFIWRVIGLI